MDSLISEMEKLLVLGREDCDIQDIIGESAGKNIDDLLTEADKLISETLPYFQSTSNTNDVKASKDFNDANLNCNKKSILSKNQQNDTKKVVFNLKNNSQEIPEKSPKTPEIYGKLAKHKYDEERKKNNTLSPSLKNRTTSELKGSEVNFMKTQLQVSSSLLDNHNRIQTMCNRHDKLTNSMDTETQDQFSKSKLEEELNYYKLRNHELEKNLMLKEQEIRNWENRYQQLNQYCELFLKRNIEETLSSYGCQLNELIERNMTRESQLCTIINNLLEEIERSHLHYRVKLSEKNEQICQYLDYIQRILNSIYELRKRNNKL